MDTLTYETASRASTTAVRDRFDILDRIGSGGTSSVWRALDRDTGEMVALKALNDAVATNPIVVARFEREAQLAARIRHANVAIVHGLVEQGGTRYLAMEYVEGSTLGAILASKNKLPIDVALRIFGQICEGVQAAHDEGVIHRDLKPENVLVARRDGRVVLLDFGIAKTLGCAELTQEGLVVGTIHYMSPEQLCGAEVTPLSDIYALGVILYELVTGACPFRAPELTLAQCVGLRARVPDPRDKAPLLPEALASAVMKCLAIDPRQRFASPRELWDLLSRKCPPVENETRGVTLFVGGREVVIGRTPEAIVAMMEGEQRDQVVDRLRRIGCIVTIATSGPEALQRSFERGCQLLVMGDGVMGLDPFTACQIMRRFARWDATRALVLVDVRDPARQSQAIEAGADDVGTLPLQIHAFTRQARRLLRDGS